MHLSDNSSLQDNSINVLFISYTCLVDRQTTLLHLVDSLGGRDGRTLRLIEGVHLDGSVAELDLVTGLILPGEGMLHPVDIVSVGVILSGMGTSRLLSGDGRVGGLHGAGEQVLQLEGLGKISVPDHGSVGDTNLVNESVNSSDTSDTILKRLLGSENGDIHLHGSLHLVSNGSGGQRTVGVSHLVKVSNGLVTNVSRDRGKRSTGGKSLGDSVGNGSAEDNQIEQGVGSKSVGTVDGDTGGLTTGEQTLDNLVLTVLILSKDLTGVSRGDTTHVVVNGGENGDGLLGNVNTSENGGGLGNTGESLVEHGGGQMRQLEEDVVAVLANTSALSDLQGHGSRHDISGGQILGGGSVSLHESLTVLVEQISSLTSGSLSNQTAGAIDTGRVELDKLQILEGKAGSGDHGHTVTSTGVGRGTGEVGSSVTTGGQNGLVGSESMQGSVLLVVGNDTDTGAVLHEQVHGEVLNKEVSVVSERLSVKRVQHGVAGSVGNGTGSVGLASLTVVLGLTTEGSLVDSALVVSREGNTVVFQLDNGLGGLLGHVVDGVLVSEPIGTLDGVIHVPLPVIGVHVSESGVDTSLRSDGVGSGGEQLGDTSGVEASLGQTEGGSETGSTGSNNNTIVLVVDDGVLGRHVGGGLLGLDGAVGEDLGHHRGGGEVTRLENGSGVFDSSKHFCVSCVVGFSAGVVGWRGVLRIPVGRE